MSILRRLACLWHGHADATERFAHVATMTSYPKRLLGGRWLLEDRHHVEIVRCARCGRDRDGERWVQEMEPRVIDAARWLS